MMDGNQVRFFEADPRVVKAIRGGLPEWVSNPIAKLLWVYPGRVLRPMATTFQLAFQFKQLMRDPVTAWRWLETQGLGVGDALHLYRYIGSSLMDQALFHTTSVRDTGWTALMKRAGMLHMTMPGHERLAAKSTSGKLPGKLLSKAESMMSIIEVAASAPELATRSAVARIVAERLGVKDPNQKLTPLQAIEMMSAFQRGTTNFGRQGEWTRIVNIGVPFFTARIAELTRLPGDLARNPYKFGAVAAGALALGVWHALAHNDKTWYAESDIKTKMNNAWFETSIFGEPSRVVGIPLDNLTALGWGIGQMIGNVMSQDPNLKPGIVEAAKAYFGQNVSPLNNIEDLAGVAIKEVFSQYANKDLYFDRPIVPPNLTYKSQQDQFTEYTTELAKKVGHIMGWSPMRIDHAIRAMAPAAARALSYGEKVVGVKQDKDTAGNIFADTVLGIIPSRYGTSANIMDRSTRLFYDKLIEARLNKPAETPEEAMIRKKLEKINQNTSYLNTVLHAEWNAEDREALKQKKRALLNLGISIANGALTMVPGSQEKGKALQIRKQQTAAESATAKAEREFSLFGATE